MTEDSLVFPRVDHDFSEQLLIALFLMLVDAKKRNIAELRVFSVLHPNRRKMVQSTSDIHESHSDQVWDSF
jgi:hypothetical protein